VLAQHAPHSPYAAARNTQCLLTPACTTSCVVDTAPYIRLLTLTHAHHVAQAAVDLARKCVFFFVPVPPRATNGANYLPHAKALPSASRCPTPRSESGRLRSRERTSPRRAVEALAPSSPHMSYGGLVCVSRCCWVRALRSLNSRLLHLYPGICWLFSGSIPWIWSESSGQSPASHLNSHTAGLSFTASALCVLQNCKNISVCPAKQCTQAHSSAQAPVRRKQRVVSGKTKGCLVPREPSS
jgi:hypothetical protein